MQVMQLGPYRFDPVSGELWIGDAGARPMTRSGERPVDRLRPQAAQVLTLLAERPGRLVSRKELQQAVWPDTEVELDQGLNACIREIRAALGDRADEPTFVETVPRRGYRWIAPLERRDRPWNRRGIRLGLAAALGALAVLALGVTLGLDRTAETPAEPAPGATAPAVRDRLLRARHLLERGYAREADEEAGVARARELLHEARLLDPSYAPVTVELARTRWRQSAPEEARALVETVLRRDAAREPVRSAVRAEAHLLRALLALFEELDPETSRRHFEIAARLAPGSAEVHQSYAFYFVFKNRPERAIEEVERALRLDPVSPNVRGDVGWVYYYARRWEDAARQCRAMLELTPESVAAERCVLLASLQAGDLETARSHAVAELEKTEAPEATIRELATAPGDTWLSTYWRWRLEKVATRTEMPESWRRVETARALLGLDRRREALASLERAVGPDACAAVLSIGVDPLLDPLRREPRFRSLLERLPTRTASPQPASPQPASPQPTSAQAEPPRAALTPGGAAQPTSAPALRSSASTARLSRIPVSK